jgi:hypothetical protein
MSEQVITIKEIAEKPGKKGPYKIVTSGSGAKYYAFDPATFDSLKPGANVKLAVEQQGDYTHIKGVVIEGPRTTLQELSQTPQAKPPSIAPMPAPNARDASIEAQVAVKAVGEMVSNGKLDINGKAGQYAVAWCIIKLREALPPVAVEAIDLRLKEQAKPKTKD